MTTYWLKTLQRAAHLLALLALVLLPAALRPDLTTPTALTRLTPVLMVEDVNATVAFYRDVLGFGLEASVPETGALDFALMRRDGVDVMFQSRTSLAADLPAFADLPVGGAFSLYIDLDDVDDLYARIRDKVTVVKDLEATFYGTREFTIRDPNGFILTFAEG